VSGSCTDHGGVLNRGETVHIDDTLDVPEGGNLKRQMAEGSVIWVPPDSTMTVASYSIDRFSRDVRLLLTRGALRAPVISGKPSLHIRDIDRRRNRVGGVRLRDWLITAQRDSAQVGVLAGTIDLRSAATG
jgi:hypothetical protein